METNEKTPKVESVVTGNITVKKDGWWSRTCRELFAVQDSKSLLGFLRTDVLIPAVKRVTYDLVTSAIDMLLYGGNAPANKNNYNSYNRVNYAGQYKSSAPKPNVISGTDVFAFEKIMFSSKRDALAVLDQLYTILDRYGIVTVAQFYDSANYITDNHQANKFGWMDLSGAEVVRDFSGDFYIKLPPASPID